MSSIFLNLGILCCMWKKLALYTWSLICLHGNVDVVQNLRIFAGFNFMVQRINVLLEMAIFASCTGCMFNKTLLQCPPFPNWGNSSLDQECVEQQEPEARKWHIICLLNLSICLNSVCQSCLYESKRFIRQPKVWGCPHVLKQDLIVLTLQGMQIISLLMT